MDPPACVQNAMMTKDKKPFTYTPGGIDLSEVRSPRMARRLEHNASLGGTGDLTKPQQSPPVNYGPLPPSTLAAMRPQPQVQVFPSGPPPPGPIKAGGVPPPPPPMNMPPPPPPPSGPLPTQKVRIADNQTLERPDMTKIIPENPMTLLRKTSGPQPRKSIVDEMFEQAGKGVPQPRTPPTMAIKQQSQYEAEQPRYQPVVDRGAPISPQQQYPQARAQPQIQPPKQQYQPSPQQYSPEEMKEQPRYQEQQRYQPPVIERKPVPRQNSDEPEIKTSTAHLGSLYIPPVNQQQQKRIVSPPTPPERSQNNSGLQTPPLKEAPRPWQTKKPQQEELPPWTKRDNQVPSNGEANKYHTPSPPLQQQQQRWPQSKVAQQPPQYPYDQETEYIAPPYKPETHFNKQQQSPYNQQNQQQPIGVRIEIRTNPTPEYTDNSDERKPNAVYVTQPLVFQHPGPRQPQQQVADNQGAKVEGSRQGSQTPSTPGSGRTLNRQQSWGNPTQSNTFKIIQKITQTDEDEDDDTPVTQHSPRFPQNFEQPADQVRRMKINDGDPNMANRFKQVPGGVQTQPRQPQVRTIPIQIEGDDTSQKYVHPSEQVVPEPKKYTGSKIPSRSFKILQAMTAAPDNCANVDDQNEASLYDQWGYDATPYNPYPPPPYWLDYYHSYYYPDPNAEFSREEFVKGSSRPKSEASTPVPLWGDMPSYPKPKAKKNPRIKECIPEKQASNSRSTPLPFWNGYSYYTSSSTDDDTATESELDEELYSYYSPYYDPYYYHYYYGYPPMYPPYPYYRMSDTDDFAGYYSADESYSNKKAFNKTKPKKRYPTSDISKRAVTPTLFVKEQIINNNNKSNIDVDTESESDTQEEYEEQPEKSNPLKSIKSVKDISVYDDDENISDHEIIVEECSDGTNEDSEEEQSIVEDCYPHQLSVILEESERTDSRMRSASVLSDSTTIADKSDVEDEEPQLATAQLPLRICVNISDSNNKDLKKEIVFEEGNIKTFKTSDMTASFNLKTPNTSCKLEKHIKQNVANVEKLPHSPVEVVQSLNTEESNTIEEAENDVEDDNASDESEDWWGIIGKEDDLPKPKTVFVQKEELSSSQETINSKTCNVEELEDSCYTEKQHNVGPLDDLKEVNYHVENLDTSCPKEEVTSNVPENSEVVVRRRNRVDIDLNTTYKRRSVYDNSDEEENDENNSSGTLLEMDNFVEQFEEIKRNSGLWNFNLKDIENKTSKEGNNKRKQTTGHLEYKLQNTFSQEEIDFWEAIKREEAKLERIASYKKIVGKQNSTDYTKYNSSKSSAAVEPVEINKMGNNLNRENNDLNENEDESESEESSDSESSSSDDEARSPPNQKKFCDNNDEEPSAKILSIQERIKALKESIKAKQSKLLEKEAKNSVKENMQTTIEASHQSRSKTASTKSSLKSFEEISEEEEEVDSGVTSDMSRHISDSEEFPELKKLTKYQRAATHSRLFKLLQDECDNEDIEEMIEEEKLNKLAVRQNGSPRKQSPRRNLLTLPLNKYSECESISSNSGRNSPSSSVNEKLISELVHSLLKCKKGQVFRNIPKEKLYAAAAKILQEDLDGIETPSDYSSFMSPLRSSTGSSTAAQTPQEFNNSYEEYRQYYESWNEAERHNKENSDILSSKAFKLLQEHSDLNKTGFISGLLAKCPKVISSKNIHRKIMKLLENSDCSSPTPDKPLDSKEVTTAS